MITNHSPLQFPHTIHFQFWCTLWHLALLGYLGNICPFLPFHCSKPFSSAGHGLDGSHTEQPPELCGGKDKQWRTPKPTVTRGEKWILTNGRQYSLYVRRLVTVEKKKVLCKQGSQAISVLEENRENHGQLNVCTCQSPNPWGQRGRGGRNRLSQSAGGALRQRAVAEPWPLCDTLFCVLQRKTNPCVNGIQAKNVLERFRWCAWLQCFNKRLQISSE